MIPGDRKATTVLQALELSRRRSRKEQTASTSSTTDRKRKPRQGSGKRKDNPKGNGDEATAALQKALEPFGSGVLPPFEARACATCAEFLGKDVDVPAALFSLHDLCGTPTRRRRKKRKREFREASPNCNRSRFDFDSISMLASKPNRR